MPDATIARPLLGSLSEPRALRLCGILILAAFPLYGGGQALMNVGHIGVGLALTLVNSGAVFVIGLLMRAIIGTDTPFVGRFYFSARLVEGLALAAGAFIWAVSPLDETAQAFNTQFYRVAMTVLALGSLPFCHWLVTSRRLPALIGWGGLVGYLGLGAGMATQQIGYENLTMWLLIPGALFELIFGIMLVAGRVRNAL